MISDTSFVVAALAIALSLVLGGGTRSGFLADAILQYLSIPLLLLVLARWSGFTGASDKRSVRIALLICVLFLLLPLFQLIPIPPATWSRLGGRELVSEAFDILNRERPWLPLSLTPRATWLGLLSLVPILTVFLATLQAGYRTRRALCLLVIGFSSFSVIYGMLQLAQGQTSPLRLFAFTNTTEAVGLFANRNHYASLLYTALLLTVPFAAVASANLASAATEKSFPTGVLVSALASFTVLVMLLSAQAMARSRTGLALSALAIMAGLMLPLSVAQQKGKTGPGTGRVLMVAILLALVFAGQFAIYRVMERFDVDTLSDARIPYARNTIEAALAYMPFGSGIGSFVPVYGFFEKAGDIHRAYANRAHNDMLEAWLETGAAGMAVFALFVVWYLARGVALFGTRRPAQQRVDALLARASFLVIGLLLAHSLTDYPLRTGAMGAVFAFCCALLLSPPPAVQIKEAEEYPDAASTPGAKQRTKNAVVWPSQPVTASAATYDRGLETISAPPWAAAVPQAPLPGPTTSKLSPLGAAWPIENETSGTETQQSHEAADRSAPATTTRARDTRWEVPSEWPEEWRTHPRPDAPPQPQPDLDRNPPRGPPPLKPTKARQ